MSGGPRPEYATNVEFRSFVHQKLSQKLREMGLADKVSGEYMNQAIDHYMQPGSPLRMEWAQMKDVEGKAEVEANQFGGGTVGEKVKRTAADVGIAAANAFTSPGRAAMWLGGKLGIPGAAQANQDYSQTMEDLDQSMGNKGYAENTLLAAIQRGTAQAAGTYAGSLPTSTLIGQATNNAIWNAAERFPASKVLGRLASRSSPAANTMASKLATAAQNAPRAIVTGMASGMGAMPMESFSSPEGFLLGAGLSAAGAAGSAHYGGPIAEAGPGRISSAYKSFNDIFASPSTGTEPGVAPEAPTIAPIQQRAPGPVAPAAEAQARVVSQQANVPQETMGAFLDRISPSTQVAPPEAAPVPRVAKAVRKPMTGGDKVNFSGMDPAEVQTARDFYANMPVSERVTKLLKEKEAATDPRMEQMVMEAADIADLPGFLQRRVLTQAGVNKPKAAVSEGGVTTPPPITNPDVAAYYEKRGWPQPGTEAPAAAAPLPRQATLIPKATIQPQEPAPVQAAPSLEEQVAAARAENAQLKGPEPASVSPPTPSLQEQVDAMKATNATLRAGQTPPAGPVKRGKAVRLEPMQKAETPNTPVPGATETPSQTTVHAGWWDSEHAIPAEKEALINQIAAKRQTPLDAAALAKQPWVELNPRLRTALAQMEMPRAAEGGAPTKGAGFRKRKATAQPKSGPAAGDIPETDVTKRIPKATRKPKA